MTPAVRASKTFRRLTASETLNESGLAAYATRARRDGFAGMMAIHPSQVGPINAVFTPTDDEVSRAQAIVEAFAANHDIGVLQVDGKMVDALHLKQARHILSLAI
jgi:citrate lyase subunit beta/citryl-CoA lyase